jgi:AcrR family transcriptional regulator
VSVAAGRSGPAEPKRRSRAARGSGEELRPEILAATRQLLAESGDADEVSIRRVAAAVGVTPPSIYLHFADKDALLAAVVVEVFADIHDSMTRAAADFDEPAGRAMAMGLGYVRFALAHPEEYRLATMRRSAEPDGAIDEMLADTAFQLINATVVECVQAGLLPGENPLEVTLRLWSAAHGVASLMIAKPYVPWGDQERFARLALRAIFVGESAGRLFDDDADCATITDWIGTWRAPRAEGSAQVEGKRGRRR